MKTHTTDGKKILYKGVYYTVLLSGTNGSECTVPAEPATEAERVKQTWVNVA